MGHIIELWKTAPVVMVAATVVAIAAGWGIAWWTHKDELRLLEDRVNAMRDRWDTTRVALGRFAAETRMRVYEEVIYVEMRALMYDESGNLVEETDWGVSQIIRPIR